MGADDPGEGIAYVRSLGRLAEAVWAIESAVVLVLAVVADPGDAVFPPSLEVGDAIGVVGGAEEAFCREAKGLAADRVRLAQADVIDELRVSEDELVGGAGAEDVGVVGQINVGRFLADWIAWIRNGARRCPP